MIYVPAYVRPARPGDAQRLAALMEPARRAALEASMAAPPENCLPVFQDLSADCCLAIVDDEVGPIGLFGASPHPAAPDLGLVWLVATERLATRHHRIFLRQCARWIEHMLERYPVLFNLAPEHDTLELRWLKWCGFEFILGYDSYGPTSEPHVLFARARDDAARGQHDLLFTEGPFAYLPDADQAVG